MRAQGAAPTQVGTQPWVKNAPTMTQPRRGAAEPRDPGSTCAAPRWGFVIRRLATRGSIFKGDSSRFVSRPMTDTLRKSGTVPLKIHTSLLTLTHKSKPPGQGAIVGLKGRRMRAQGAVPA